MILLAGLLILLALALYFEFKYMRPRRKDELNTVLVQDEAYNAISSTNAVAESLHAIGKDTAEAEALMVRAQLEYDRKDYPKAIATAKVARDLLINARERPFEKTVDEDKLLESVDEPGEIKEEEEKSVHEVKKLPQNYLESKFLIYTTKEEMQKAKDANRDVSLAEACLLEADRFFAVNDYAAALHSCMKARRTLAGRPNDVSTTTVTVVADVSQREVANEKQGIGTTARAGGEVCGSCGAMARPDDNFCPKCGAKVIRAAKCPKCQGTLAEDDAFCRKCGAKVS